MRYFHAPGKVSDLFEAHGANFNKFGWNIYIQKLIRSLTSKNSRFHGFFERPASGKIYVDKASNRSTRPPIPVSIVWNAFPRRARIFADAVGKTRTEARNIALKAADTLEPFIFEIRDDGYREEIHPRRFMPEKTIPMLRSVDGRTFSHHFWQRQQDEYLEWFVHRDGGRIKKIVFTSESQDYWQQFAIDGEKFLVDKYKELVDSKAVVEDVRSDRNLAIPKLRYDGGARKYVFSEFCRSTGVEFREKVLGNGYNSWNKWNTTEGIIHTTRPENTISAGARLASKMGQIQKFRTRWDRSSGFELLTKTGVGDMNRNSDVAIAIAVNNFSLGGYSIALSDPVGVYVGEIRLEGLRAPDGTPIHEEGCALHLVRPEHPGSQFRVLRFEIRAPDGANYDLHDCTLDGEPLRYGGQIAERVTMVIDAEAVAVDGEIEHQDDVGHKACPHPSVDGLWARMPIDWDSASINEEAWSLVLPFTGGVGRLSPAEQHRRLTARWNLDGYTISDAGEWIPLQLGQERAIEAIHVDEEPAGSRDGNMQSSPDLSLEAEFFQ